MATIIIKTQEELDKLPDSFGEYTVIEIHGGSIFNRIVVKKARENSRVEAWANSRVVARENSRVEAWANSSVEARANSRVVARENSRVEAWENSRVEARENSSVEAWANSRVEAWENSRVEARENSSVEARANSSVHVMSTGSTVELHSFAVAWLVEPKAKATKKEKTATIIKPKEKKGVEGWLENNGVTAKNGKVTLYKRVSSEFKTQENTQNETTWTVGSTLEHPNWEPKKQECGAGKYHACGRAYDCNQYRDTTGDKYVALEVAVKDLYAWPKPEHPRKVAVRKAKVLFECNQWGDKL